MKRLSLVLLSALLASASAYATVTEQQWGNWYGNTGGMEFSLSSQNRTGQTLTFSCSDKQMTVTLSSQRENWSARSDEGLDDLHLLINRQSYDTDNSTPFSGDPIPAQQLFNALAHTKASDTLVFTSRQTGASKPFSAHGLSDALKGVTWQDCMSQP
ncbi:MAG: hypothetical protein LBU96_06990 [Yokenella regensburgei]|jgi:hypothetical protein|nr:hypothetical protein [Yokenella regensburgei]